MIRIFFSCAPSLVCSSCFLETTKKAPPPKLCNLCNATCYRVIRRICARICRRVRNVLMYIGASSFLSRRLFQCEATLSLSLTRSLHVRACDCMLRLVVSEDCPGHPSVSDRHVHVACALWPTSNTLSVDAVSSFFFRSHPRLFVDVFVV